MNREIKFRAWLGDKMQYGVVPFQWDYVIDRMCHTCIGSNGSGILGSGGTEAKFEVYGFSIRHGGALMQYTGLEDTNGIQWYEGEIIFNTDRKEFAVISYSEKKAMFVTKYQITEDEYPAWESVSNLYCSVGNIYEHAHLLNSEQEVQVSDTTKMS